VTVKLLGKQENHVIPSTN